MKYLFLVLILAGCTVNPGQWDRCQFYCKPNEGLKYVSANGSCYCENDMKWIQGEKN